MSVGTSRLFGTDPHVLIWGPSGRPTTQTELIIQFFPGPCSRPTSVWRAFANINL
jgi:hypothetical protein